jgi:L-aminopeptidase/D-esterase-like protein
VAISGPAPGSRETALLEAEKAVQTINAILLTGGSAFGLAAADGVVRYLAERGIGHPTPIMAVPIVAAAVVYDLFLSQGHYMPGPELGYAACEAAAEATPEQGSVGAGAGASVGKWGGRDGVMKGGFGYAVMAIGELEVAAGVVVNAIGDVVEADGSVLAGARRPGGWLVDEDPLRRFPDRPPANVGTNTTLAVIMTNAVMDKTAANRLARRGHDGLAIAVRPIHTTHDGDAVFALTSGVVEAPFDLVGNATVEVIVQAIRNAVRYATDAGDIPGLAGPNPLLS